MKFLIKKILKLFNYELRKRYVAPVLTAEQIELMDLAEFKKRNGWFKNYNINTVLDIGANEGQFAKKICLLFPEAKLHCFEPLNDPFLKLKKQFGGNSNVNVYNFALGDLEENREINLNEYSPSSSFLEMGEKHKSNFDFAIATTSSNVSIKRLDDLNLDLSKPLLIKIDVQGFEDKVINGGKNTIKKADVILIEVTFRPLYESQPLFDNIYQALRELGFSYQGNFDQLLSPLSGEILQADAIFINNEIISQSVK